MSQPDRPSDARTILFAALVALMILTAIALPRVFARHRRGGVDTPVVISPN